MKRTKTIINDLSPLPEPITEKLRFRTKYNYTGSQGEVNDQPSETIHGQALTVRELLLNYTRGVLPPISKTPQYSGTDDFDDFDPTQSPDFDLADATILIDEIKQQQNERAQRAEHDPDQTRTQQADKSKATKEHRDKLPVEGADLPPAPSTE